MINSNIKDYHVEFENKIVRRMNAFLMAKEEGFELASIMYPNDVEFLIENKKNTYQQMRQELVKKLKRV